MNNPVRKFFGFDAPTAVGNATQAPPGGASQGQGGPIILQGPPAPVDILTSNRAAVNMPNSPIIQVNGRMLVPFQFSDGVAILDNERGAAIANLGSLSALVNDATTQAQHNLIFGTTVVGGAGTSTLLPPAGIELIYAYAVVTYSTCKLLDSDGALGQIDVAYVSRSNQVKSTGKVSIVPSRNTFFGFHYFGSVVGNMFNLDIAQLAATPYSVPGWNGDIKTQFTGFSANWQHQTFILATYHPVNEAVRQHGAMEVALTIDSVLRNSAQKS